MNQMNFQQVGGVPLETNTLTEVQKAYSIFNALGELAGDKSIISGCKEIGNEVTNGFIYLGGELLEFRGAVKQTKIKIVQEEVAVEFEDKTVKPVYYTRYATFGTGIGTINWSDFKRYYRHEPLHKEIKYIGAAIGKEDLPLNWFVADGTNGTDNLIDLFIKGTSNPNQIGVSGSDKITLRSNNIPEIAVKFKGAIQSKIEVHGSSEITGFVYTENETTQLAKAGSPNPTATTINPKHFKVIVIQYIKP